MTLLRELTRTHGMTMLYYYNPEWQVLAEHDGSNNLQRYCVCGKTIDEPLLMNDGTDDFY